MHRFLEKLLRHRGLWAVALASIALAALVPNIAFAGLFDLGTILPNAITTVVFVISYILSMIGGVLIAIQGWFLEVILNISFGLVNSAPVRIGFPIVLSLANLFFVGALIVIAIATILRKAEYGAKKVLWKLVVVAILVNFGLVICGTILSVSDEITKFFIQSVVPGTIGDDKQNIFAFSESIAGAFNPSGLFGSYDQVVKNPALASQELSLAAQLGNNIGNIIKPLTGLVSTLGSLIIIIILLATLNLMLLWRYVRLGMALIVLPLAWAAWIFPAYHEHYSKWWKKFTQWAFFPPIVVFFIWLGLKVSEVMSQQSGEYEKLWSPERGAGSTNYVSEFLGTLITPVIGQTMKTFILFGIMMAGIFAANEMGIKFADSGIKAIERTGSWAKGKAMNYAKRAGRATYQGTVGKKVAKLTQNTWGQGIKNRFGKGVVTTIGSGAAMLGRGMGDVAQKGGSDVVDSYKDSIPKDTAGKIARLKSNNNMPEILAMLSSMSAEDLSKIEKIGGMSLAKWLDKYHGKIGDYSQHELEKNLKDMGASPGLAAAALGKGGNLAAEVAKAMKDGDPKVLAKLLKSNAGLGLEDPTQVLELHKAILRGIGQSFSPSQLSDFVSKMNAEQIENFKGAIEASINSPESANITLGEANANLFRKNGAFRGRLGSGSELWHEPGRPEGGTGGDLASQDITHPDGRKAQGQARQQAGRAPAPHAPTPPRGANPPAAPGHGTGGHTPS